MNLKKHLLVASIAATSLMGMGEAAPRDATDLPKEVLSYQKADQEHQAYKDHYEKIRKNIDGANFSFGDTKLMRATFLAIAKNPVNYELVKGVPENYVIQSDSFSGDGLETVGGISYINESVTDINTSHISSTSDDLKIRENLYGNKGNGVNFELYRIMKHEMIHEVDKTAGRYLNDVGADKSQIYSAALKTEAQTHAWGIVDELTYEFVDRYGDIGSAGNLEKFKNSNVNNQIEELQKIKGFDYSDGQKKMIKLFHQKLKSGMSFERTQKEMVGILAADFLGADSQFFSQNLRKYYHYQAAYATLEVYTQGKVTLKGNPAAEKKLNNFFMKEYKLDFNKVAGARVPSELSDMFKRADQILKMYPDTKSTVYQNEIQGLREELNYLKYSQSKKWAANEATGLTSTFLKLGSSVENGSVIGAPQVPNIGECNKTMVQFKGFDKGRVV